MNIKWYPGELEKIGADVSRALEDTGDEIIKDLRRQQTLPYAENPYTAALSAYQNPTAAQRREARAKANATGIEPGELQRSLFVDTSKASSGVVSVVTNTPYARRLYFHPEYHFYQGTNRRAGGEWYKPYMTDRKEFVIKAFSRFLRRARA